MPTQLALGDAGTMDKTRGSTRDLERRFDAIYFNYASRLAPVKFGEVG